MFAIWRQHLFQRRSYLRGARRTLPPAKPLSRRCRKENPHSLIDKTAGACAGRHNRIRRRCNRPCVPVPSRGAVSACKPFCLRALLRAFGKSRRSASFNPVVSNTTPNLYVDDHAPAFLLPYGNSRPCDFDTRRNVGKTIPEMPRFRASADANLSVGAINRRKIDFLRSPRRMFHCLSLLRPRC